MSLWPNRLRATIPWYPRGMSYFHNGPHSETGHNSNNLALIVFSYELSYFPCCSNSSLPSTAYTRPYFHKYSTLIAISYVSRNPNGSDQHAPEVTAKNPAINIAFGIESGGGPVSPAMGCRTQEPPVSDVEAWVSRVWEEAWPTICGGERGSAIQASSGHCQDDGSCKTERSFVYR
ncbi:NADH-cytochrome b5 reductase 1 [Fusarium oxysporum f. sp. albedinis]|nr:NADH-cytochrome b5 reductase 1 [Fusarium oxysporum f. sp. albedinis]